MAGADAGAGAGKFEFEVAVNLIGRDHLSLQFGADAKRLATMPSKPQNAAKVLFHDRGRDPETAWCIPLAEPNQFRLDNILFLHARPVYGDVILARPARAFDGALAFERVVKPSGPEQNAMPPRANTTEAPAPTLFDAIRTGDSSAFAGLKRADMGARDERGRSLLFVATLEGRTEIVRKLIARGAPVNPESPTDFAPLLAAAMRNRPVEAKLLLQAGARPELACDKDGDPALVTSAFRENIDVVRVLLAAPHPVEHKSLALLEAAGVGNLPIVKLLVEHGADPRWKSSLGNSALSIAKKKRKPAVVAFFASLSSD